MASRGHDVFCCRRMCGKHNGRNRRSFFSPAHESENGGMRVSEDALCTPAGDAAREAVGIVESVCTQRVKHVSDRNRFFLRLLLLPLLRSSNCYPHESRKRQKTGPVPVFPFCYNAAVMTSDTKLETQHASNEHCEKPDAEQTPPDKQTAAQFSETQRVRLFILLKALREL